MIWNALLTCIMVRKFEEILRPNAIVILKKTKVLLVEEFGFYSAGASAIWEAIIHK